MDGEWLVEVVDFVLNEIAVAVRAGADKFFSAEFFEAFESDTLHDVVIAVSVTREKDLFERVVNSANAPEA
jgi:hypothetical protein